MEKISPTPYHVQGQLDKVTLTNFQFSYLVYLLKLLLLGLLLITPVTVWLSANIADIQVNAGKLRSDVHQLTDSVNALVKNQKTMLTRFKVLAKVVDAIEASLDALVLDIPVQTALSTRIAVASEAQQQLLIEYLPTIAGFDPVLKAIQVAVEESSSVTTDIAADLSLIEASTTSAAADLTALLAAFGEYATVMEPIVSVITGDLSAVVGDYFNPIFKLGGWHIRSIHSTVDVLIKQQPIAVTLSAPITIPPIQLPPITLPPGFVLPVQVTNPFIIPESIPVRVINPFSLPAFVPVQITQSQPITVISPPSQSLNVSIFNTFKIPDPLPVHVTNSPAVMIANEDPIAVMLDQDIFVQLPNDATVTVSNPFVLPETVQVVFNSADSIFRTEVIAPDIFSVAVMNFPDLSLGIPDKIEVATDLDFLRFFTIPHPEADADMYYFVHEFNVPVPAARRDRLATYFSLIFAHCDRSIKYHIRMYALAGLDGHCDMHVYCDGQGEWEGEYAGYCTASESVTGGEKFSRRIDKG